LERTLRGQSGLELIRAGTTLEAIGEAGSGPGRTVVVVAPDAEPGNGRSDGSGCDRGDGAPPEEVGEFAQGLRMADPDAVLLRVGKSAPPPYDGAIAPEATGRQIMAAVESVRGTSDEAGSAGRAEESAPPRESAVDAPVEAIECGDEAIVRCALAGGSILERALELIRRRTGDPSVRFVPGAGERGGAAVVWRGRRFGTLVGERSDPSAHAGWLGCWLALERQQEQLRRSALTDFLTGAWNRRFFDRFLRSAIESARNDRRSLTLLIFDIDGFKTYNDRFGHSAGDEILVQSVRLMGSVIRPDDKVCRIWGDEFAVIFHEPRGPREPGSKHPESINDIARRFQRQICEHRFPKLGQEAPGPLTISGGLATFPWDAGDADELIEVADQRACQSKRQGKNAITFGPAGEGGSVCEAFGTDPCE